MYLFAPPLGAQGLRDPASEEVRGQPLGIVPLPPDEDFVVRDLQEGKVVVSVSQGDSEGDHGVVLTDVETADRFEGEPFGTPPAQGPKPGSPVEGEPLPLNPRQELLQEWFRK